jgi:hypothetical protein
VVFLVGLGVSTAQPPGLDEMDAMTAEEYLAHITEGTEGPRGWHARELTGPFEGVTTDGETVPGLYSIRSTGVSTEPVRIAAETFLATLDQDQRERTLFAIDDEEWRKWMNIHSYLRQGVSFREFTDAQRGAAFGLLGASLSAKGLELSQDIMKLNTTLAELNGDDFIQYGEDAYSITIMGTPSATEPWGWQIDGHHLVINYFVLGDQVVMTPAFWGSEPVFATSGRHAGTWVLQEEQDLGLKMYRQRHRLRRRFVLSGQSRARLRGRFGIYVLRASAYAAYGAYWSIRRQYARGSCRDTHVRGRRASR